MGCKAGYPESPCPFGFEGTCTRQTCGPCVNFVPPRHILQWCKLWDRDKVLCLKPKSACETCPEKCVRLPGRPAGEGRDMRDPKVRREYEAEYRERNADKVAAKLAAFKKRNPTYWRDYMRRKRAAKEQQSSEQGDGQVRGDAP
jgi:hypothetical protein